MKKHCNTVCCAKEYFPVGFGTNIFAEIPFNKWNQCTRIAWTIYHIHENKGIEYPQKWGSRSSHHLNDCSPAFLMSRLDMEHCVRPFGNTRIVITLGRSHSRAIEGIGRSLSFELMLSAILSVSPWGPGIVMSGAELFCYGKTAPMSAATACLAAHTIWTTGGREMFMYFTIVVTESNMGRHPTALSNKAEHT